MTDQSCANNLPGARLNHPGLDRMISAARDVELVPPGVAGVWEHIEDDRRRSSPNWRVRLARLGILGAIAGLVLMSAFVVANHLWVHRGYSIAPVLLPAVLPGALLCFAVYKLDAQDLVWRLLIRGILWSNTVVGTIAANTTGDLRMRLCGLLIALGCVLALVCLGSGGLLRGRERDGFAPVAYQGRLSAALIMACADAQTLFFAGMIQLANHAPLVGDGDLRWSDLAATAAAIVMAVIVWGILRMRTVALVANVCANLAIAALALHGYLGVPFMIAGFLAFTAACQLLLPVPVWAAALGDEVRGEGELSRHATRVAGAIAAALCLFASVFGVFTWFMWGMFSWQIQWEPVSRQRTSAAPSSGSQTQKWTPSLLQSGAWVGQTIKGFSMQGVNLPNMVLDDVELMHATIETSTLKNARLRRSTLRGVNFVANDMAGTSFARSNLEAANFFRSDLDESSFVGARLRRATFDRASLRGVDFSEADLYLARLASADLRDTIWRGTRCPDGTVSDDAEDGTCLAHLGALMPGDRPLGGASGRHWFLSEDRHDMFRRVLNLLVRPDTRFMRRGFYLETERYDDRTWLMIGLGAQRELLIPVGNDRFVAPQFGIRLDVEFGHSDSIESIVPTHLDEREFRVYRELADRYVPGKEPDLDSVW